MIKTIFLISRLTLALKPALPYNVLLMITKIIFPIFLFLILFFQQDHSLAQPLQGPEEPAYQTEIRGDIDDQIHQVLMHISDTVELADRPLISMSQLQRRIRDDISEFVGALRSFGYYAPSITYHIMDDEDPVQVVFEVFTGPEFLIKEVSFINLDPEQDVDLPQPQELGLLPGERIRSAQVRESRRELDSHLRKIGFPFPRSRIDEVIIDHADHSATIFLAFDPGPRAFFGKTEITGLDRVKPDFIREKIPWDEQDEFQSPKMDDLRRELTATGLFSIVEVNHARALEEDRKLPMYIWVRERPPRTARAGVGYQSDIGLEFRLGWMHRNLFGRGENLDIALNLSEIDRSLETTYIIPSFLRPDQSLTLRAGYVEEFFDAYDSTSLLTSAMLERRLTEELSVGAGVGYRLARVEQFDETIDLGLLFFPGDLLYDNRDDVLNPSQGLRFNLRLIPFLDTLNFDNRFLKSYASLNNYFELLPDKRIIFATRVAYGAIGAESLDRVPPDERFYAGGGGSIRGYPFQKVGPLEDDEPIGGLSLIEINTELRLMVTRRSGIVLFVDGGQAYRNAYPDLTENLLWGAGLGYRYHTDFGPLRIDVAVPLDRRRDIDDAFQFYISLGQAF